MDPPASSLVYHYKPDYASLIKSTPEYMSWHSHLNDLTSGSGAANRKAAVRALALSYGGLPEGFTDKYGDLDASWLAQAAANPYSTTKNLQRSYEAARSALQTGLAARGAYHSGELGYGLGNLATQEGGQLSDAALALGTGYGQAVDAYTGAIGDYQATEGTMLNNAENTLIGQGYVPRDVTANLVKNWQQIYGRPVYSDSSGALYMIDGNGNLIPYQKPVDVHPPPPGTVPPPPLFDPGPPPPGGHFGPPGPPVAF